jgi:exodeoxyribonuclease VII large subunit
MARLTRGRSALAGRRAPDRIERALAERFATAAQGLDHRSRRLLALSPDSVLSRGYSITQDAESGAVLRTAAATAAGKGLRIRLASGRLTASVDEVET